MSMDLKKVIIDLCDLPGPSGFEEKVTAYVKTLLEPYTDEVRIDVMGNVIGVRRCGTENAPKLLFDAHIDEIGLIVTGVEEGFLRFAGLGGLDARVIPASGVMIQTNPPIYGVISVLPPHIMKKEDTEKNFKIEDLFIDIGMTHDEAVRLVTPGTHGTVAHGAMPFGDNLICGKAIDDRIGLAAILRALDLLKDIKLEVDLYIMASVQEEVGLRGAIVGAYSVSPDYCVVVEVHHAKTPDTKNADVNASLGDGVIIVRGPNMNPMLTEKIFDLAKENDIKHQVSVISTGMSGTNARSIQISREGVATALLGIPLKYMHCANELSSLDDTECAAQLLAETAKSLKGVNRV